MSHTHSHVPSRVQSDMPLGLAFILCMTETETLRSPLAHSVVPPNAGGQREPGDPARTSSP